MKDLDKVAKIKKAREILTLIHSKNSQPLLVLPAAYDEATNQGCYAIPLY